MFTVSTGERRNSISPHAPVQGRFNIHPNLLTKTTLPVLTVTRG